MNQVKPVNVVLLLLHVFGHLFMQLSKFAALDGHVLERLNEVLTMTDGAGPILAGGQARTARQMTPMSNATTGHAYFTSSSSFP
jgi:hypothetical protein